MPTSLGFRMLSSIYIDMTVDIQTSHGHHMHVCMYIYFYVYVYVYVHLCVCEYVCEYVCVNVSVHLRLLAVYVNNEVSKYMLVCMYKHVYTNTRTYIYICMNVPIYKDIYVSINAYIHIYISR